MQEFFESEDKKIQHPLRPYPLLREGLVDLETFQVVEVTCVCGKCGAELTGPMLVEAIGQGCFRPVSPEYGGMDKSLTVHHTETNDGFGDGEHRLFIITGQINGFAFVTGQGCGVIRPKRSSA